MRKSKAGEKRTSCLGMNSCLNRGKILDAGCGYGFISYMLAFSAVQRDITGIDFDEDKNWWPIIVSAKQKRSIFFHSDVTSFQFDYYDCIILSDMLHYPQPDQQDKVIRRSIEHLDPAELFRIREGDKDAGTGNKQYRAYGIFLYKIPGFNKTAETGLSFLSGKIVKAIALEMNMDCHGDHLTLKLHLIRSLYWKAKTKWTKNTISSSLAAAWWSCMRRYSQSRRLQSVRYSKKNKQRRLFADHTYATAGYLIQGYIILAGWGRPEPLPGI